MHKRTYNVLKPHTPVTIWGVGPHRGKVGVVRHRIEPRTIEIQLADGTIVQEDHRYVAVGNNSYAA